MKRLVSLMLALTMIISLTFGGIINVSADDEVDFAISSESIDELTSTEESENLVSDEIMPEDDLTQNDISEDEDISFSDYSHYDIKELDNGEYIAYNIDARDVEVYVTDGYSPVQGAVVNVAGKTETTDADGKARFEAIPTSDEKYTITVEFDTLGQRTYDIMLLDSQTLESADQAIETAEYTVSFWTPDSDITASAQALTADTFSLSANAVSDVSDTNTKWTYDYNAPINVENVFEYNGYIYVLGDTNKVYNTATGTWATLSGEVPTDADHAVFCNGKIYTYSYAFYPSGDTYSYYYRISSIDLSTGNSSLLIYKTSGGHDYSSAIECNGKIYFAGGNGIEYDTGAPESYENVDVYDPETNTLSTVCDIGTYNIIETVVYDDTYIYYFSNTSSGTSIDRLNTTTNTLEYVDITGNYIAYDGESVCATAGKVYFIGGDEALHG